VCGIYLHEDLLGKSLISKSNDWVELQMMFIKSINLALIVIYRPPKTPESRFTEMLTEIEIALDRIGNPSPNIILCGDFNFPFLRFSKIGKNTRVRWDPIWISGAEQRQADALITLTSKYLLMQEITGNTRGKNCLDLLFTNNLDMITDLQITPTDYSDHNLIDVKTSLQTTWKKMYKEKEYSKMNIFDLYSEQTDWDGIRQGIEKINWELTFANLNVSDMIDILEEKVTELLFKHAERKQKRKYRTRYAKNRRALFRKRNRILKKLNNCINPRLKVKFTEELRGVDENIKNWIEYYTELEESKAVSKIFNNSRYFYSFAKSRSNMKTKVGPLMFDGIKVEEDEEMVKIFKEQYESQFSTPKDVGIIDEQFFDNHSST
jgi:hypothetical protein